MLGIENGLLQKKYSFELFVLLFDLQFKRTSFIKKNKLNKIFFYLSVLIYIANIFIRFFCIL